MERIINYFANDDKKVGFTLSKMFFNSIGLSWWGKPHLLRTIYKPMPIIILCANLYGSINHLLEMEIVDAKSFIHMIQYFIIVQCMIFVGLKIFLFHCYSASCRDAIEATENLQLQRDITNHRRFAFKIIKFYTINIVFAVTGWLVHGTILQGRPMKLSLPFDFSTKYPIRFLIVWVLQVFGGFYVGAGNGATDTILLLIVNVMVNFGEKLKEVLNQIGRNPEADSLLLQEALEMHIILLNKTIQSLRSVHSMYKTTCKNTLKEVLNQIGRNPEADSLLLQEALEMHIILLKLKDKVIKGFSMITLFQIIYTIGHTCFILFAATKVSIALFISILAPMLIADSFQLLVYCYTGQMLSSTMEELSFAAYDNQWYNSSIRNRKNLIRLMEVLKRPVELNSFGIVKACFETYLNTIKESFSYYVVVKTFASDFN